MQSDKFHRMLGLATRAGKVVCGEGAALDSIRNKKACLIILSEDASENTRKRFCNSCSFYSVPYITGSDRHSLGKVVGRDFAVVIAVNDKGFAEVLNENVQ